MFCRGGCNNLRVGALGIGVRAHLLLVGVALSIRVHPLALRRVHLVMAKGRVAR